jgi:hypothetical protein
MLTARLIAKVLNLVNKNYRIETEQGQRIIVKTYAFGGVVRKYLALTNGILDEDFKVNDIEDIDLLVKDHGMLQTVADEMVTILTSAGFTFEGFDVSEEYSTPVHRLKFEEFKLDLVSFSLAGYVDIDTNRLIWSKTEGFRLSDRRKISEKIKTTEIQTYIEDIQRHRARLVQITPCVFEKNDEIQEFCQKRINRIFKYIQEGITLIGWFDFTVTRYAVCPICNEEGQLGLPFGHNEEECLGCFAKNITYKKTQKKHVYQCCQCYEHRISLA